VAVGGWGGAVEAVIRVLQVDARCLRHPILGAAGQRPPPPSSRTERHGLHPSATDTAEEALWGWTDGGGRRRGGGSIDERKLLGMD
jgi:hypothetical protein